MSDLLTAAKNGYYSQVVSLLNSKSCDVDARDKDKATPLYWSASRGHAKICQVLLQAGCDINASVKWGSTALHAAADRGHADCLTVLLDRGVDVQVQNERGDTALHLAAYRGYKDLVQLLIATGRADPFLKNAQSKTPMQEAQSQQHTATSKVLQQYMESLGCHPFKSLPVSEASGRQPSPQEQPTSSTPAQSWPRYQSFPKFPDPAAPADLSRPHTHPQLVNNLSQGSVSGSHTVQGPSRVDAGSEIRLSQFTGIRGLKGLPGFAASPGERLQPVYVHSDPQENLDECVEWSKVQMERDALMEHNNYVHGDGDNRYYHGAHLSNGVRLNQLSCPTGGGYHVAHAGVDPGAGGHTKHCTSPSSGTMRRYQNGQDGLSGVTKFPPYQTDFHPPQMVPPKHHPQGFVKHEDLTLFAESLQLEVVKLRDDLSNKEHHLSDLENVVSSLRTQNTQLQQLLTEKEKESKEMLASKESEISDLKRRLCDMERQNLCLQKAVAEGQTSLNQISAQREGQILDLTVRVSDLERLNTSLQQLLVTQQDTMKRALVSKDLEIAGLRDKLAALAQNRVSSPAASSEHSVPSADRSLSCGQPLMPADGPHSLAEAGMRNQATANLLSPNTSAVISACDQSLAQPSVQTDHLRNTETSKTTPDLLTSQTSPVTLSAGSLPSVSSPGPKPGRVTDGTRQCRLRAAVSRLFQDQADAGKLDADGREWSVGTEFQLLDSRPVNCGSDGQRRGSCSLVFSIKHQGRKYMLKMLTNLINLSYEAHSQGRSLDAHLLHCFGAEFHAPLLLHQHPNIVRVRHHYQGDTSQFTRYLHLLMPPSLDVPVEMARRTTFLVLEHYPQTLQTFMDSVWKEEVKDKEKLLDDKTRAQPMLVDGLREGEQQKLHDDKLKEQQFILQMVYQLLSAVEYLQRHDVVHRDIKADNVFLDWRLRPVLGDFGLARTLRGYGRQALAPFTDSAQVMAGNSHAWAPELCRWSRTDPSSLAQPVTLKDIYDKSDGFAVARMLYLLFHKPCNKNDGDEDAGSDDSRSSSSSEERFPTSTLQRPHYPDSAVPLLADPLSPGLAHVLRSLVLDDPAHRPSVRQALCRVGVLLFKPDVTLTSEEEAEEFCASQLEVLSTVSDSALRCSQPEEETLSVAQSVTANQNHCLADFLLNFSGKDFWEAYMVMTSLGF